MNLFGRISLTEEQLNDKIAKARSAGYEDGVENSNESNKNRIENLEKDKKRLEKEKNQIEENLRDERSDHERELARLKKVHERDMDEANETIKTLVAAQTNVREVVAQEIINTDKEAVIKAEKERLEAREAKLKERESKVDDQEEGQYKKGYADGVADGVRKISEITQQDRDNAMKIAMVAASSHTPAANMKEVMDVNRQLGAGEQKA